MDVNSMKNYHLIKNFVNGFLDKRTRTYKNLKAVNTLCREAVEKHLSQNPDIEKLLMHNNEQSAWMKELIINHTLLMMYIHAFLWQMNDHKP